jgi:hypothetical protein
MEAFMAKFVLLHLNTDGAVEFRRASRTRELAEAEIAYIDLIYDLQMPTFSKKEETRTQARDALKLNCYVVVAEVESPDLASVFSLTNNVEESWVTNQGIRLAPAKRAEAQSNAKAIKERLIRDGQYEDAARVMPSLRSTSVGDVVVDGNGDFHLCHSVGWLTLDVDAETKEKYVFSHLRLV